MRFEVQKFSHLVQIENVSIFLPTWTYHTFAILRYCAVCMLSEYALVQLSRRVLCHFLSRLIY